MRDEISDLDRVLDELPRLGRVKPQRGEKRVDPDIRHEREGKLDDVPKSAETSNVVSKADDRSVPDSEVGWGGSSADLAIVVALPDPELQYVLRLFSSEWRQESRDGVLFNVGKMAVGDEHLSVVAAAQNDMGMVPAAILATKTINAWRPTLLAMVGICAGVRARVELGDIIVAQEVFDYGSGKLEKGRLRPDYRPVSLDERVCALAKDLAREKKASAAIRSSWPVGRAGSPQSELGVHVGPMASGAAVVAENSVVADVEEHKRSLLGVDMEAYGVARAAGSAIVSQKFVIAKGVQDFADAQKGDEFRDYAAFVSAAWLHHFVSTYWSLLRS